MIEVAVDNRLKVSHHEMENINTANDIWVN